MVTGGTGSVDAGLDDHVSFLSLLLWRTWLPSFAGSIGPKIGIDFRNARCLD
jgi:hypothetical protein